ncbi:unnamed protein product [Periconia digitata]|uniref:Uncharacterized protein n=1 Tax=Periconia digitata TaxID=1303443 RepID=A0A9W4UBH8_9PLEO|nr:unnamed protein product [Periconia digitata]
MSSPNVLGNRDTNAQLKQASSEEEKPKSMQYHRDMLQSRLDKQKSQEKFVSPSDAIMSPATQKLSAHRGRNILKNSKPKTLFMQTSSKNHEAAKDSGAFEDISKSVSKEDQRTANGV